MVAARTLAALALLILALTPPATDARADDQPIVWCFGDSISVQLCKGIERSGYADDWNLFDHGYGGWTSKTGVRRLSELLYGQESPDVVFVQFGTNDLLHGALEGTPGCDAMDVYERLEVMESMIEKRGGTMIWTTTPVRDRPDTGDPIVDDYLARHQELNRKIRKVTMRTRGSKFKDFGHPRQSWVDEVLAPRLARKIDRVLAQRARAAAAQNNPE